MVANVMPQWEDQVFNRGTRWEGWTQTKTQVLTKNISIYVKVKQDLIWYVITAYSYKTLGIKPWNCGVLKTHVWIPVLADCKFLPQTLHQVITYILWRNIGFKNVSPSGIWVHTLTKSTSQSLSQFSIIHEWLLSKQTCPLPAPADWAQCCVY